MNNLYQSEVLSQWKRQMDKEGGGCSSLIPSFLSPFFSLTLSISPRHLKLILNVVSLSPSATCSLFQSLLSVWVSEDQRMEVLPALLYRHSSYRSFYSFWLWILIKTFWRESSAYLSVKKMRFVIRSKSCIGSLEHIQPTLVVCAIFNVIWTKTSLWGL